GNVGKRFIRFEEAMRAKAPCMHDPLWDAFMIEMEDLFAEVLVLEQGRPPRSRLERILVVGNWYALLRGEDGDVSACDLMRLSAGAAKDLLIGELGVL